MLGRLQVVREETSPLVEERVVVVQEWGELGLHLLVLGPDQQVEELVELLDRL